MKICVFGTGYVGLVTGVCLAEVGNTVSCVDIDQNKINNLKKGISPIFEPGLSELLANNIKSNRLFFTTNPTESIENSEIIYIAVGTPSDENGAANLKWVKEVAGEIGRYLNGNKTIILKSTVPVGTNILVKTIIQEELKKRGKPYHFNMISNPEFLREGCAINDCMKPDRIIVGCENSEAKELILRIYKPFIDDPNQVLFMDLKSSELTKYAANAILATKISFMNELSMLCEKLDANIEDIKRGISLDHRIGPHFINAGLGYGGSCFPKDVKALIHSANEYCLEFPILNAVEEINQIQRTRFIQLILSKLKPLSKVSIWGIAFKPGTDDIREAPALEIMHALIKEGHSICAFDPVASENSKKYFLETAPNLSHLISYCDDQYMALDNSDTLVISTEWEPFKEPDFERIKKSLKSNTIFDGRNIYNLGLMKELGFNYHSIGRPAILTSR